MKKSSRNIAENLEKNQENLQNSSADRKNLPISKKMKKHVFLNFLHAFRFRYSGELEYGFKCFTKLFEHETYTKRENERRNTMEKLEQSGK